MVLAFSSSVALRDVAKTFARAVTDGEYAEFSCRVLPSERFQQSFRNTQRHDFQPGERVVLLSLTAAGWIDSGFKGTILSIATRRDAKGRQVPHAEVEWDECHRHPSRICQHAVSRLRLLNNATTAS